MKLKFYEIDNDYIQYLKQYDNKIPDITYSSNNKFVLGIVLRMDHYHYFAPISSFAIQQQTNLVIKNNSRAISSIRFSFMFPIPIEVLNLKDFSSGTQSYRDLLNVELQFCNQNIAEIKKKQIKYIGLGQIAITPWRIPAVILNC